MEFFGWLFATIGSVIATYRYIALFVGCIVEGPLVMVATGFLVKVNAFDFWPAFFVLMFGDLAADYVWYQIGRHTARPFIDRFGHFFSITKDGFEKMEVMFQKHHDKILFISKITMGFGFALVTLMAAGAVRVSVKKYMLLNFLGGFVWTAILMGAGYLFGNAYYVLAKEFRILSIIAAATVVLALLYGFNRFMRKKFS